MISSFYFPWRKREFEKLFFVTSWRVTREEPELLTDIRDFITQFNVTLRRKSSKWLEGSFESVLGMRFAIWIHDLAIRDLASFKHFF